MFAKINKKKAEKWGNEEKYILMHFDIMYNV